MDLMNLFKGKKRIGKFLDVPPQEATEKPARQMADTVQEQVPDELGELYEPDAPREEAPSAPPPSEECLPYAGVPAVNGECSCVA